MEEVKDLYCRQVELLNTLLEHKAISRAQHDKSLHDLTEKMAENSGEDVSKWVVQCQGNSGGGGILAKRVSVHCSGLPHE